MKLILLSMFISLTASAQAPIRLWDVAVMGFASHDLFEWDKNNEVNIENGRLDLSSFYDHAEKPWNKGGNPKNAQNAAVWSFTQHLVKQHKKLLKSGLSQEDARAEQTRYFHELLKESFQRLTGLEFPTVGYNQEVTNQEQAAMRGLHDILPGKVKLFRIIPFFKEFNMTNPLLAKTRLNEKELLQELPFYDGKYDEAYENLKFPFSKKVFSLVKIDGEYIEKFSPWTLEEMLADLGRASQGKIELGEVFFMRDIHELFSKGICPVGSMPQVECY